MNIIGRSNAILPIEPNETHVDKEGYAVKASSGKAALLTGATDLPIGVILEGSATTGKSSVALCAGGLKGTIRVKLGASPGTVALGTNLQVESGGTFIADAGSGSRVVCAQACESGSAGEFVEAVLFKPLSLS